MRRVLLVRGGLAVLVVAAVFTVVPRYVDGRMNRVVSVSKTPQGLQVLEGKLETDDQLRRIAATGGLIGIGYGDGAVVTGFDASELLLVSAALLDAGLAEDVIARVMGENVLALVTRTLPAS
jgi:hypothetical protein